VETSSGTLKSFHGKTGEQMWALPQPAFAGTQKLSIAQIISKPEEPLEHDCFVIYVAEGDGGSFIAHVDTTTGQLKSHCPVEAGLEIRSLEWCQDMGILVAATNRGVYVWTSTSPPTPRGIVFAGDVWSVKASAWQIFALKPSTHQVFVMDFRHHTFACHPINVNISVYGGSKHGLCSENQDDFAVCQSDRFIQYSNKKPAYLASILPL
jgi:hypothetical protein